MQTADQRTSGRTSRGTGRGAARLMALLTAVVLLGLTGCGSGDSSGEQEQLDIGGSETPGAEEQLEQLVADYESALTSLKKTKAADGSLDGVLTPELAEKSLTNYRKNIFAKGNTIAGHWRMKVQDVEVNGDTADIEVCADGSEVFVVDAKNPRIGEDSTRFETSSSTLVATRTDDGWRISGEKEHKGSCK